MYRPLASMILTTFFSFASLAAGECQDGLTPAEGCLVSSSKYHYDSPYNGRETLGENLTTTSESTSITVPTGYYDNKTITWLSDNLLAANLKEGVNAFGVTGILNANATAACTLDSPLATTSACDANAATYIYTQASGGRGLDCNNVGGAVQGNCFLTTSGATVRSEATTSNCSRSGAVTKTCMVTANSFWYTSEFGGRSLSCINGVNTTSCWLPVESASVSVANLCRENTNTAGYNATPCRTAGTNRFVYTSDKGGRANICLDNDAGFCWIDAATKAGTATNLTASNIRLGRTIYGIAGTYNGVPFAWGSGAHRLKSVTDNRRTYTYESTLAANVNLPSDYYPIPKIASSTDGFNQPTIVTPVNRTGWSTTECGTTGSIQTRASNCTTVFNALGSGAIWIGERHGNAGQTTWQLITRRWSSSLSRAFEVWQDTATGLIWSSRVSGGINWCKASGNSASTLVRTDLQDVDPFNICSSSLHQNVGANNAISACYEGAGFVSTGTTIEGKASLNMSNAASSGKVAWRLPTIYDYMLANHHGLRFVLPDTADAQEWTATTFATDRSKAWTFDGNTGARQTQERRFAFSARCVGR